MEYRPARFDLLIVVLKGLKTTEVYTPLSALYLTLLCRPWHLHTMTPFCLCLLSRARFWPRASRVLNIITSIAIRTLKKFTLLASPFSSDRQHLSYDGCLEVRRNIIRTVLCFIVYWKLCTVISTLRWAVLTVLWIGFCLTGPISLCVDSCVYVSFALYCRAVLLQHGGVDW